MEPSIFITYNPKSKRDKRIATRMYLIGKYSGMNIHLSTHKGSWGYFELPKHSGDRINECTYFIVVALGKLGGAWFETKYATGTKPRELCLALHNSKPHRPLFGYNSLGYWRAKEFIDGRLEHRPGACTFLSMTGNEIGKEPTVPTRVAAILLIGYGLAVLEQQK